MWVYEQKTGKLFKEDGTLVGTGYSGKGEALNNPAMQDDKDMGPTPEGFYTIGPAFTHPKLGPLTMTLIPDRDNHMFGRSLFRIHGDNMEGNKSASEGCIIQGHDVRKILEVDRDRRLHVVCQL